MNELKREIEEAKQLIQDYRDGNTKNFSNKQFITLLGQLLDELTRKEDENQALQEKNDLAWKANALLQQGNSKLISENHEFRFKFEAQAKEIERLNEVAQRGMYLVYDELQALREENARYRETLEWYATADVSRTLGDWGTRARNALIGGNTE